MPIWRPSAASVRPPAAVTASIKVSGTVVSGSRFGAATSPQTLRHIGADVFGRAAKGLHLPDEGVKEGAIRLNAEPAFLGAALRASGDGQFGVVEHDHRQDVADADLVIPVLPCRHG